VYYGRHRRKPLGRWALGIALGAVVVCAGGVAVAALAFTDGIAPKAGATLIPASVTTAAPKQHHEPGVKVLARSVPVSIRIPAIGVDAPIMKLSTSPGGIIEVPPLDAHNLTGWWEDGAAPGQRGRAVILGHVDSVTGISVFYDLRYLRTGDKIYVKLADGKVPAFVVDGLQKVAKTTFPTAAVYGRANSPELRLVTCGGPFDESTGHYIDNIIVYAQMT
jgi:LPXTG-site transpeptidase (sortase) family protein